MLSSSAVLILMSRTKPIFVHFLKDNTLEDALFSVRSGETFAKNNQLALRSGFKNCLVGELTGLSGICIPAVKECPPN